MAAGRGGHDPDNPLCLTVTNRTRAHPGSGRGVRRRRGRAAGGVGGGEEWGSWRGREAG